MNEALKRYRALGTLLVSGQNGTARTDSIIYPYPLRSWKALLFV
jgi:hypothetical protein